MQWRAGQYTVAPRSSPLSYMRPGPTASPSPMVAIASVFLRERSMSLVPLSHWQFTPSGNPSYSRATKHVVKELTRILLNNFDQRYHPTTNGQLKYKREALVGHGNRYISIHPCLFKAAFLDPCTHHFLRNIMEADNFHEVC